MTSDLGLPATGSAPSRRGLLRRAAPLGVALGATFVAAALGSAFTTPALDGWYASLAKPAWNPPNWIFGPVWTALYTLMAVAVWLAWRAGPRQRRVNVTLYAAQLAVNVAWSGVFFGLRSPGWAVAVIVALWAAIAVTAASFHRVSRTAAWLLAPYLVWVTFAAALNVAVWRLNG